ncbi:hypothetical protein BABINDRAFT_160659 [Babjeviella inositovora NRRL Y-12698]|uniref:Acyl-coenzyme A oxidase n=1 Tax=Babjeviella inositovora NRRL Y-12698 TaxID=984486 RepID=A0A1E3QUQ4_9ASCO|nr:uncharacterized protein BABINDRAFT_160659 [Babjeviella inositovora NRRL Y-12698]ODQ81294.1 hypothetical protein BABINDRAFT_160659 [Babjeviella inositovora NRRL Y-12698]
MSVTYSNGPDPASTIAKERAQTNFDLDVMNQFLEGGSAEQAAIVKSIYLQFERDPILSTSTAVYDLTKEQKRELTARKIARMAQYLENDTPAVFSKRLHLMNTVDPQVGTRIAINLGLFLNCVRGNGTDEQFNFWIHTKGTSQLKGIYGCFGMTELAHGSNVAGLETTATFDVETDEFVINTPHVGATKWWIGGAAHSSSHCAVYARLIVKGVDHGVKTFVVALRDANHELMPGVSVGDIGAKMGRDGIDNGWIQFNNVRIPHAYMLSKYDKVARDGTVSNAPLAQLAYSALLDGRVTMIYDSFRFGSRFVTIALRYAVARRQFGTNSDGLGGEEQLLNYPLHQNRLLPYLASVYAMSATGDKMNHYLEDVINNLEASVKTADMRKIGASIEDMKNLFVISASLKSTCTWLVSSLIDECRQACGGHGYSAYSGFGQGYTDWVVQCTWEGDNNVLAMSAGKTIVQNVQKVLKGKKNPSEFAFLNSYKAGETSEVLKGPVGNLSTLLVTFQTLVGRLSGHANEILGQNGGSWEVISVHQVNISKIFAHTYILSTFTKRIAEVSDPAVKTQLTQLAQLYALSTLSQYSSLFLQYNVLSATTLAEVQAEVGVLNTRVRPQVVGLTDAFQMPDFAINSALGSKAGNIYETYFGLVKNQNDPSVTKAPYSAALEKMLNRQDLNVRERNERTEQVLRILGGDDE